ALFHRSGRQSGKADDVARSVDVCDGGTIIFIDGQIAAVIDGEAGLFESEAIDGGAAACCKKRSVRFQNLAGLHCQLCSSRGVLYFHWPFVEPEIHAKFREAVAEAIGDFGIEKWKQTIAAVHQGHFHAERHEDRGVLATNNTAADDSERFWNAIHLQKCVRIESVYVIEENFGGAIRF